MKVLSGKCVLYVGRVRLLEQSKNNLKIFTLTPKSSKVLAR